MVLILAMLVASILVGVLAAVAPSIRAARLNILQAIAAALTDREHCCGQSLEAKAFRLSRRMV